MSRHVLVVEDDPNSLSALAELIEHVGFTTATATTLAAARAQVRQRLPDVLLVERRLPDGNGIDWLAELAPPLPRHVIIISGDPGVTLPAPLPPAQLHLFEKPVDISRLLALLRSIGGGAA